MDGGVESLRQVSSCTTTLIPRRLSGRVKALEELASLCSAISLSRMAGATRILKPIQGGWCQSFHLLPLRQLSRADQRREG